MAAVEEQFAEIKQQLSAQLTRTGQMQVELDKQHREIADVHDRLREVQAVLKQLLTSQ